MDRGERHDGQMPRSSVRKRGTREPGWTGFGKGVAWVRLRGWAYIHSDRDMPSFPKPNFDFNYRTSTEKQRLRDYRDTQPGRAISAKTANNLLIGTWNIANLGQQQRRPKDYELIAEIISWFDIVAIQETKDDLSGGSLVLACRENTRPRLGSRSAQVVPARLPGRHGIRRGV